MVDSLTVSPFGKIYTYSQSANPRNIIIMISGDAGWKFGVVGFAESFAEKNNLVIGIDVIRYFKELRQRTDECYAVAADFVAMATEVEKKYNLPEYKPPVLMGYSSGATLVYGILAQARPDTFIGGISLGFCPDIDLPKMLCQTNGLSEKVDPKGKSYFLEPDARLGNQWIVLHGQLDNVCNYAEVAEFVKKTTDAELITLPNVGHGFSKWADFMPQWNDALNRLLRKYEDRSTQAPETNLKIRSLPVTITYTKVKNESAPFAILISGDGGWYSFEQDIADHLSKIGIPTIGLDSKKYFWKKRTPEETASDMETLISYFGKEWNKEKILFVGYSLGSEIVPFILTRLHAEVRADVDLAVLLSPDETTDFEVHISNMLGMGNRNNTYKVVDEIKKIRGVKTLCIFGEGENSKVPELLRGAEVKCEIIPGDHHYKFNVPLILQKISEQKAF